MYRCEPTTITGFIQKLAVDYVARGYWFYFEGYLPEQKDPHVIDEKLIGRYGIDLSYYARCRRKRAGSAAMQYLRHERFYLLLATHGRHQFFDDHGTRVRDVRRVPIKFHGYSVSYRNGHASVRIERERFKELKAYFLEIATRRPPEALTREIDALPYERYAPVRSQLLGLLRAVNRKRKAAGLQLAPNELRLSRRIVRPFEALPEKKVIGTAL